MLLFEFCLALVTAATALGDDGLPPRNTWTTAGGGPARSGEANAEAVKGPVEIAWSVEAGGEVEGEPRVWGDAVFVCVRRAAEAREVQVLDLETGAALVRPLAVRSRATLEPAVGVGAHVVYRSTADQITAARLRTGALRTVWTHDAPQVGPPLVVGDDVYLASAAGLVKRALYRKSPLWTASGVFVGAPAVRDARVFAVQDEQGLAYLTVLDAASGTRLSKALLGSLQAGGVSPAMVASFGTRAFVRLAQPLPSTDPKRSIPIVGLDLARASAHSLDPIPWSISSLVLPVRCNLGWWTELTTATAEPVLAHFEGDESSDFVRLATRSTHAGLVDLAAPGTCAGEQVIVGPYAIDARSLEIDWRVALKPTERAVVARSTVLFVDAGRRIVAVRSKAARAEQPVAPTSDLNVQGVLVLRDGAIERGDFRVERAAGSVTRGAGASGRTWRLADVLLLCDGDAVIQCGSAPLRGIAELAREERARELIALGVEARSSGDPALVEQLLGEAADAGADDTDLAKLEEYVENAAKSRNKPTVKAEIVARVQARRARLQTLAAQTHWRFAQALIGEPRARFQSELVRRTLQLDATHEAAGEHVRKLVPLELRPSGAFDALDALELVEAHARAPIRVEFPLPDAGPTPSLAQRELAARTKSWRPDLLAMQSRNLLIVTPVRRLGALASCLAHGELVCRTLETLFEGSNADAAARAPLVIELFESEHAYIAAVKRHLASAMRDLTDSKGHYDSLANVSRFYMNAPGAADADEVLSVTAHELTHHWLRARSPKWAYRDLTLQDVQAPGYWVVEGFACLIEHFAFDVPAQTWAPGGANSKRLDLVAHASGGALMPWDQFFARTYGDYDRWTLPEALAIPSSIQLGKVAQPTVDGLFYSQSEATAHFLFNADGGALRPKLFEFLANYYSGKYDALDLPALLGVDAAQLGARIQAHAASVLQ
jgi:hypothetical protein